VTWICLTLFIWARNGVTADLNILLAHGLAQAMARIVPVTLTRRLQHAVVGRGEDTVGHLALPPTETADILSLLSGIAPGLHPLGVESRLLKRFFDMVVKEGT